MKVNKTIRILTFHSAYSFGAFLQSFALLKFLEKEYTDVKIIDLRPELFSVKFKINSPKSWIKYWQFRLINKLNLTNKYNPETIRKFKEKCDVFIIGSDQVWNPKITKNLKDIYFGNFVSSNIKKISYASSFGKSYFTEEEIEEIRPLFKNFDAVSTRESTGVTLVKKINGQEAISVLDPTFLYNDYIKYFKLHKVYLKEELCLFVLDNNSNNCFQLAQKIGYKLNLRLKVLNKNKPIKGFKNIPFPSIKRFLEEIYKSKFIITNSFHGLVFSIIFRKQFIYVCTNKEIMTRPYDLLLKLQLTDRFFYSYEEAFESNIFEKEINYSQTELILQKLIALSKEFLLNAINK